MGTEVMFLLNVRVFCLQIWFLGPRTKVFSTIEWYNRYTRWTKYLLQVIKLLDLIYVYRRGTKHDNWDDP